MVGIEAAVGQPGEILDSSESLHDAVSLLSFASCGVERIPGQCHGMFTI